MEKLVTFASRQSPASRNFENDALICWFDFSVVDSSLIGTPRERPTNHSLKVTMSHELLANWGLETARGSDVTSEMVKVAFQKALEQITEQIKTGSPLERELSPLSLTTRNCEDSCPYNLSQIAYPDKVEFTVSFGESQLNQPDLSNVHPNIGVLIRRMDDSLRRSDFAGVLHASASIFETMAKDVVGIQSVQNQTLKSFFDRYRRDSALTKEILDYILGVYDLRNTTPLAGHGGTQTPAIAAQAAVSLAEMTKAFIRIEYTLRQKQP
jgi:hypothetical protein